METTCKTFVCSVCNQEKERQTSGGTGYGTIKTDNPNVYKYVCYACIAESDRKTMIDTGKSNTLPLYLTGTTLADMYVGNWPGSLKFKVTGMTTNRHNFGGKRINVWFNGPDGFMWYGYQIGEYNEVCHAKRTKTRSVPKRLQ